MTDQLLNNINAVLARWDATANEIQARIDAGEDMPTPDYVQLGILCACAADIRDALAMSVELHPLAEVVLRSAGWGKPLAIRDSDILPDPDAGSSDDDNVCEYCGGTGTCGDEPCVACNFQVSAGPAGEE